MVATRHVLVVMTKLITPASTSEYEAWHREVHLPAVLRTPGFQRGHLFRRASEQLGDGQPIHEYLTLYDVEGENLEVVIRTLQERVAHEPEMRPSSLTDSSARLAWFYTPVHEMQA